MSRAVEPRGQVGKARRSLGAARTITAAWVVILLAVLSVGWLLTHPGDSVIDPWDDEVARWFAAERTGTLSRLAAACSHIADTRVGVGVAIVVAAGVSVWQRSGRPLAFFAVLLAGAFGLYVAATRLFPRDRPPVPILDPGLVPDHSFPSGHVTTAVVVYGGTALLMAWAAPGSRRWTWLLLIVPVVMPVARVYQGAHHPTDVLTTLVYASVWLAVVTRAVLPRSVRE